MSLIKSNFDVLVGNGQLGTYTNFTSAATAISLVPGVNVTGLDRYTSVYSIETANATTTVTLPSPANVIDGWQCRIYANLRLTSSDAQMIIQDHLGNTVFIFYSFSSVIVAANRIIFSSATFMLNGSTWVVEPEMPQLGVAYSTMNFNLSGYPRFTQKQLSGRLYFSANDTDDVNVLFSSNTPIRFLTGGNGTFDPTFYTFTNNTSNIVVNVAGNYQLSYAIYASTSGSATKTGIQFAVQVNTVTVPFVCATSGFGISGINLIKANLQLNAGDSIRIIVGKLAIVAGVINIDRDYLNINYLG